jgi:hypothetical protein
MYVSRTYICALGPTFPLYKEAWLWVISFEYGTSEESVEQFMLFCKLGFITDYCGWKSEFSDSFNWSPVSGF